MTSTIFPFNLCRPALKVYHESLEAFQRQITAGLDSEEDLPAAGGMKIPVLLFL